MRQGNFVTQDMVAQLKPGLSRDQVRFILGSPLVADMFHADRWDYVYRFQPGRARLQQRTLTVFFQDNKLTRVAGDVVADDPLQGGSAQACRAGHRHTGAGCSETRRPREEVGHGQDSLCHCRQFGSHGPDPDRGRASGRRCRAWPPRWNIGSSPFLGKDAGELVGAPCGVRITADLDAALADADCLIDFTRPEGTLAASRGLPAPWRQPW